MEKDSRFDLGLPMEEIGTIEGVPIDDFNRLCQDISPENLETFDLSVIEVFFNRTYAHFRLLSCFGNAQYISSITKLINYMEMALVAAQSMAVRRKYMGESCSYNIRIKRMEDTLKYSKESFPEDV